MGRQHRHPRFLAIGDYSLGPVVGGGPREGIGLSPIPHRTRTHIHRGRSGHLAAALQREYGASHRSVATSMRSSKSTPVMVARLAAQRSCYGRVVMKAFRSAVTWSGCSQTTRWPVPS
jgi:hypothetical protein